LDWHVDSQPYAFPLDGRLEATAVLVIDMQVDFCGEGGYMSRRGADLASLRAPIEPIRRVLLADCCAAGDPQLHEAALRMLRKPGGSFGALSESATFLRSLPLQQD
jgi:nicotinamidase-related amidase